MIVTVEISHYPLAENYESDIFSLIREIKKETSLAIYTTAMSTYVKGDINNVFPVLQEALASVFKGGNLSSTVMKIIPKDLPIEEGYIDFK
jgi:uncharacterized protein YqgV (UPF0045/DUF77 family)